MRAALLEIVIAVGSYSLSAMELRMLMSLLVVHEETDKISPAPTSRSKKPSGMPEQKSSSIKKRPSLLSSVRLELLQVLLRVSALGSSYPRHLLSRSPSMPSPFGTVSVVAAASRTARERSIVASHDGTPAFLFERQTAMSGGCAAIRIPSVLALSSGSSTAGALSDQGSIGNGTIETRVWPPQNGYTFAAWVRIEKFEMEAPLERYSLLNARGLCAACLAPVRQSRIIRCGHILCAACLDSRLDAGEGCAACSRARIVLFSIRPPGEKREDNSKIRECVSAYVNHRGMITLSTASGRNSLDFSSFFMQQGRWYHIVISHTRQRFTFQPSMATLYVDGVEV